MQVFFYLMFILCQVNRNIFKAVDEQSYFLSTVIKVRFLLTLYMWLYHTCYLTSYEKETGRKF